MSSTNIFIDEETSKNLSISTHLNLAERAKFLKRDEGGRAIMAMSMEDLFNKGESVGKHTQAVNGTIRLIKMGKMTLEEIADAMELPLDEVIALDNQIKQPV